MQNISHVPIRIDWIVYELTDEFEENPKLIELISVIDNNPFDSFESKTTIMDNNDEIMSRTTISTSEQKNSFDLFGFSTIMYRNKFSRDFSIDSTFICEFGRTSTIAIDQTLR